MCFLQLQYIINMNIESNTYQDTSAKCKGCKLFFGSQAFKGFCSTCFKKHQVNGKEDMEKIKVQTIQVKVQNPVKKQQNKQAQILPQDKSRCNTCKRKVKNLGIECKCGSVFCNMHRLPQDHACTFDHAGQGVKRLQKTLIKVANQKLNKIE